MTTHYHLMLTNLIGTHYKQGHRIRNEGTENLPSYKNGVPTE